MTTMPAGPLVREHRLIEELVADVEARLSSPSPRRPIDPAYVDVVVDFFATFADRCHHGKEEDILFHDLATKTMEPAHKKLMSELIQEHEWARNTVRRLRAANVSVAVGNTESMRDVQHLLRDLVAFYPGHIRKEEREFFRDAMAYLSDEEKDAMIRRFTELDATLIHEKYRLVVQGIGATT